MKWEPSDFTQSVTTVGQNKVSLTGNELILLGKDGATLDPNGNAYSWEGLLGQLGQYEPGNNYY